MSFSLALRGTPRMEYGSAISSQLGLHVVNLQGSLCSRSVMG